MNCMSFSYSRNLLLNSSVKLAEATLSEPFCRVMGNSNITGTKGVGLGLGVAVGVIETKADGVGGVTVVVAVDVEGVDEFDVAVGVGDGLGVNDVGVEVMNGV